MSKTTLAGKIGNKGAAVVPAQIPNAPVKGGKVIIPKKGVNQDGR